MKQYTKLLSIMSENECEELRKKFDEGLALAHQRMLKEKALHDECIVVYDPDVDDIVRIPAKKALEEY